MIRYDHKRGDTFDMQGAVTDNTGEPLDITGWLIRSQIRTVAGELVAELTITVSDPLTGRYHLTAPDGTDLWPIGAHRQDIEYTDPAGRILSTETVTLRVVEDVTR
jgi:regulator of protease activity HflC (stomatin/prohibitin superfamily)